ncbi:MAG TPA: FHA domain-containing protein [Gemmataceae bacterium]|nr:FHA domain-containing protein [Gemmataceae bacterium]
MQFRLVIEKKGKRAKVVELDAACARVGRAHGNEVRIPSADVSRRHCELRVEDGLLKVEDLESVNGTYLNGDLITGVAVIRPGDRLTIGPVAFIVEYELTPAALERLREMDYEVVVEDEDDEDDEADEEVEEEVDEPAEEAPSPRRRARRDEEILEVEAAEEEEVVEVEEAQRIDLDDVTWDASGEGDLRDLLTHLDEGQESLMPRKRPGPRKRRPDPDEAEE